MAHMRFDLYQVNLNAWMPERAAVTASDSCREPQDAELNEKERRQPVVWAN